MNQFTNRPLDDRHDEIKRTASDYHAVRSTIRKPHNRGQSVPVRRSALAHYVTQREQF